MLDTILISLTLLIVFVLVLYLIRKTIIGIFILFALLFGVNYLLSYYNINLKEFAYILNTYEKVDGIVNSIDYDKDNKEYLIGNEDYGLVIKKSEEGLILKGEASNLDESNVKNLFSLLNFSSKFIPVDEKIVNDIKSGEGNIESIGTDIVNNSVVKVSDVIENPNLLLDNIETLKEGSNDFNIGEFNLAIDENDKLKINFGDVNKIINTIEK